MLGKSGARKERDQRFRSPISSGAPQREQQKITKQNLCDQSDKTEMNVK